VKNGKRAARRGASADCTEMTRDQRRRFRRERLIVWSNADRVIVLSSRPEDARGEREGGGECEWKNTRNGGKRTGAPSRRQERESDREGGRERGEALFVVGVIFLGIFLSAVPRRVPLLCFSFARTFCARASERRGGRGRGREGGARFKLPAEIISVERARGLVSASISARLSRSATSFSIPSALGIFFEPKASRSIVYFSLSLTLSLHRRARAFTRLL